MTCGLGWWRREDIRAVDAELMSFFNVNTQADLDKALEMAGL